MVKRYSHTAIVTIQTCQLVKGELVAGKPTEIEVTGQYYPSNSGQQLKRNVDGREFIVHGEFSTKARPVENAKIIIAITIPQYGSHIIFGRNAAAASPAAAVNWHIIAAFR